MAVTWKTTNPQTGVPDGSAAADELGQRRRIGRVLYAPWDVRVVTGGGRGVVAEDGDVQDVAGHFPNRRPRRGRRWGWNRRRGRSGWLEAAVDAENGDVQRRAGHRRRRSSPPQPTRDDPDQPPPDRRAPGLIDQRVSGGRLDRSTGRPSFISSFFLLTCIVLPQKKLTCIRMTGIVCLRYEVGIRFFRMTLLPFYVLLGGGVPKHSSFWNAPAD